MAEYAGICTFFWALCCARYYVHGDIAAVIPGLISGTAAMVLWLVWWLT